MGEKKSGWEIADILLRPVGGLLTALSVALVGFLGSRYLEQRQTEETNVRLYAELMSGRESADSELRRDMFSQLIRTFESEPEDLEKQLLELELLAFNFHDAIDLAPMFQHVSRKIDESDQSLERKQGWQGRLERVAKEVIDKQVGVLEDSGGVVHAAFDPVRLDKTGFLCVVQTDFQNKTWRESAEDPTQCAPSDVENAKPIADEGEETERYWITLEAIGTDFEAKEARVRLTVATTRNSTAMVDVDFNVGFFDFPLIDNTRLPRLAGGRVDERFAVVLRELREFQVELSLLYFPGSRSSLKEKPYYDQIIDQLMDTREQIRGAQ
jgi:hypothetical protein